MKAYTLGQLAWVKAVGCFWKDAHEKMLSIGISEEDAFALTTHSSFRDGDIVRVYWDYGAHYGASLERYIDYILESYPAEWPHN